MVHQQPCADGQAGEIAGHQIDAPGRPCIGQIDGGQVADPMHQIKGPAGHQPDTQTVVDHAAHGVQARDTDAQADVAACGCGGGVHGAHLYYTVSNVSVAGSQFSSPTVVGWSVNLLRNTEFGAERRIERKAP